MAAQLCDICQIRPAERVRFALGPDGGARDAYYCAPCLEARGRAHGGPNAALPRPRLGLGRVMLAILILAVANASLAWAFRGGWVRGSADQIRAWSAGTFLLVNATAVALFGISRTRRWLGELTWHRRSGGLAETLGEPPGRSRFATFLVGLITFAIMASIGVAAFGLSVVLTRLFFPVQRWNFWIFLACEFVLGYGLLALLSPRDVTQAIRKRWRDWLTASPAERACRIGIKVWLGAPLAVALLAPSFVRGKSAPIEGAIVIFVWAAVLGLLCLALAHSTGAARHGTAR